MPHGSQDYFTSIDIRNQDLAQLINRNKFGTPQLSSGSPTVTAGETKTITSLSGRGVIYFGFIYIVGSALSTELLLSLTIDGVLVSQKSPYQLYLYGITENLSAPVYLRQYDTINGRFSLVFSSNITFETSVLITLSNFSLVTESTAFNILFATI